MEKNKIKVYGNKVWGIEVSEYGLKEGYLDYYTLSKMVGPCILNNTIRSNNAGDWELVAGKFDRVVFQDYIISEYGYSVLMEHTDELVFYNENLDVYIWSVTHFGTSWDYVLTDIELIKEE